MKFESKYKHFNYKNAFAKCHLQNASHFVSTSMCSHVVGSLIPIWVRSRNCGCLVTWFCYQLIAKPGNKTAAVPWPDPYTCIWFHHSVRRTDHWLSPRLWHHQWPCDIINDLVTSSMTLWHHQWPSLIFIPHAMTYKHRIYRSLGLHFVAH